MHHIDEYVSFDNQVTGREQVYSRQANVKLTK